MKKTKKNKIQIVRSFEGVNKKNKSKIEVLKYTWQPPTKEQIAQKKKEENDKMLQELRELGIYLEGMAKAQRHLMPLTTNHVAALWKAINIINEEKPTEAFNDLRSFQSGSV